MPTENFEKSPFVMHFCREQNTLLSNICMEPNLNKLSNQDVINKYYGQD